MGLNLLSFPNVVITSATEPTAVQGKFWLDTSTSEFSYCADGSTWKLMASGSDVQGFEQDIAQIILEILRLSAEGTLTAPDYENMFVDYFSDASGQDNTIDTGNTTATWATDSYSNGATETLTQGGSITDSQAETNSGGYKITIGSTDVQAISVSKAADCTATTAYIAATRGGAAITNGTATFSGNTATFATSPTLTASTDYWVFAGSGGAGYTRKLAGTPSVAFPIDGALFDIITSYWNSGDGTENIMKNVTSIAVQAVPANKVLRTSAQALSFTPVYILVHCKDKTLAGSGAITYDVSFDGGSTWDSTANALDTKIVVTDGSDKNMVLKLNLNGTGAGNSATLKDYAIILWSS